MLILGITNNKTMVSLLDNSVHNQTQFTACFKRYQKSFGRFLSEKKVNPEPLSLAAKTSGEDMEASMTVGFTIVVLHELGSLVGAFVNAERRDTPGVEAPPYYYWGAPTHSW